MDKKLYIMLYLPGDFYAPRSSSSNAKIILECDSTDVRMGNNAIFLSKQSITVSRLHLDNLVIEVDNIPYYFNYFSSDDRDQKDRSRQLFNNIFNEIGFSNKFDELMPSLALIKNEANYSLYHFNDTGYHGSIMLKIFQSNTEHSSYPWDFCHEIYNLGFSRVLKYRHLFNDTCWYLKWNQEMELERKYTFNNIPNTWDLILDIYQEINFQGKLPKFIPEIDMEFQVSDYDNYMYEIVEPIHEKGYISFIPLTNGKFAIKKKNFIVNSELRKESITYDISMNFDEMDEKCNEVIPGAKVEKLAAYRRKRFDINFESLETGNIYGIYFDICRSIDYPASYYFSQCEVEYCRTRSTYPYSNIMEEYEEVCSYVVDFLKRKNIEFNEDLYSKLDFSREVTKKIKAANEGKVV